MSIRQNMIDALEAFNASFETEDFYVCAFYEDYYNLQGKYTGDKHKKYMNLGFKLYTSTESYIELIKDNAHVILFV